MKCEACSSDNVEGARYCATCGALLPLEQTHSHDPLIGKTVGGRFRVTRVLGEGGMGIVYEGEQQMGSSVRRVAIKTLHAHLSKDPSVMARFHRECGTVAQLEHPNTIKFYDFGTTDDGALYIAMEFVDGKALADVIEKERSLSPERVVKILRQVCGALDEAHQQGIIHRDLKPENIVLTDRAGETDFVKVLDFGIAGRTESADAAKEQRLTQQGMVLGTPPYMSPEQFTGKALDRRSDIYSLGVMAYEMLTGSLPFDANTAWEWATQHMTAQPKPLEARVSSHSLPEPLRRAIMRALSKDPNARQETARQFFTELSGGERMTVVDPVPAHQSSGTAKMEAVPNFAPGPIGGTQPLPASGAQLASPRVAAATPPAVVQPPPSPVRSSSGGGKGVVYALVAIAAVLLVSMAVIAARTSKPDDEPQVLLGPTDSGSRTAASIAPEAEPSPLPSPIATGAAPIAPTGPAGPAKPKGTGGAAGTTPTTPTATATTPAPTATATTPPTTTTPAPTATPTTPDSCDACIAAAQAGNLQIAAAAFSRCSNPAKQQACRAAAVTQARAIQTAAASGDCAKAKSMAAALAAMGASHPVLAKVAQTCP